MTSADIPDPPALDRTDARILRVPQVDGRISHLELAEAAHRAPTCAVMEAAKNTALPAL